MLFRSRFMFVGKVTRSMGRPAGAFTMCVVLFLVSQRIGILRLLKRIFVDTSVLLCCYFAFVLRILANCSPVWGSAAECYLQLLERQVYSMAGLCPDQSFLLCRQRRVAVLSPQG